MNMIKKLALASATAFALVATPAAAATLDPVTADGKATVRLYDQITLNKVSDVDYGVVVRDAAGWGTEILTMSNTGAINCAAAVNLSCTGSTSVGEFTIKGDTASDMSVVISGADYDPVANSLTLNNGADSLLLELDVDGMTQDLDGSGDGTANWTLTGTGSDQALLFYGDLTIKDSADAANGVYEANFTLTADYK